jgi:hypothetical protein
MIRSLWIARTGLDAQQTQLDVISNNLANVSTNGYKRSRAVFEDLLYQTLRQPGAQSSQQTQIPAGLQLGTWVRPVYLPPMCSPKGICRKPTTRWILARSGRWLFPDAAAGRHHRLIRVMDRSRKTIRGRSSLRMVIPCSRQYHHSGQRLVDVDWYGWYGDGHSAWVGGIDPDWQYSAGNLHQSGRFAKYRPESVFGNGS